MHEFDYVAYATLQQTLSELVNRRPGSRLLAGGTSLVPQMRLPGLPVGCSKGMDIRPKLLVSLRAVRELDFVRSDNEWLYLGALVKIRDLLTADFSAQARLLAEVAARFGTPEIRNLATVGGNICNASPAGSLLVPLMALQAEVRLLSYAGERWLHIEDFYRGPHRTALKDDELLAEVRLPRSSAHAPYGYSVWCTRPAVGMILVAATCVISVTSPGRIHLRLVCSASTGRPLVQEESLDSWDGDVPARVAQLIVEMAAGQQRFMAKCHYAKENPQFPSWYVDRRIALAVEEACRDAGERLAEQGGGCR